MTEEEFYQKIPEWIAADISTWNHITLLAYFCHKYEQLHNTRFRTIRSKSGPTNTKETKDFAKLFSIFAPENYKDLSSEEKKQIRMDVNKKIVNYINWMFHFKFRQKSQSVNGTQLFLTPSVINEFERMYTKELEKTKIKSGFDVLLNWAKENCPNIFSKHQIDDVDDLRSIDKYAESYSLSSDSMERMFLFKAKEMGLI